jgi:hypothetical protein
MDDFTPVSIAIKNHDGRLFADRADLLAAVRVINQRGGSVSHVESLLLGLNFEGTDQQVDVGLPC